MHWRDIKLTNLRVRILNKICQKEGWQAEQVRLTPLCISTAWFRDDAHDHISPRSRSAYPIAF
jgi:hypothetical protein